MPAPAVTLVVGDEDLLIARAVQGVVTAARATDPDTEVADVTMADLGPGELAGLLSPSLFAETRVVVLRGAEDAGKDVAAELTGHLADLAEGLSLVVLHRGTAGGKSLLDALRRCGANVVDVPKVKSARDRERFVSDEVRRAGATIDHDAIGELITTVGSDLRELATAIGQLVADVGARIDADAIATHHRGRPDADAFGVADRAVEGDVNGAIEQLRWALGVGIHPTAVNGALAANLRAIALVANARGGSPEQLARSVGLPPWKVRRAQGWLRGWRPAALVEAVRAVATADSAIKGGGGDPAYAVERAVSRVASAVAR